MFLVKIFILVVVTTAIENAEGRTLPVKMDEVVINPARLAEAMQEVLAEKYGPEVIERRPVVKPLSKILSQLLINFKYSSVSGLEEKIKLVVKEIEKVRRLKELLLFNRLYSGYWSLSLKSVSTQLS